MRIRVRVWVRVRVRVWVRVRKKNLSVSIFQFWINKDLFHCTGNSLIPAQRRQTSI